MKKYYITNSYLRYLLFFLIGSIVTFLLPLIVNPLFNDTVNINDMIISSGSKTFPFVFLMYGMQFIRNKNIPTIRIVMPALLCIGIGGIYSTLIKSLVWEHIAYRTVIIDFIEQAVSVSVLVIFIAIIKGRKR